MLDNHRLPAWIEFVIVVGGAIMAVAGCVELVRVALP